VRLACTILEIAGHAKIASITALVAAKDR